MKNENKVYTAAELRMHEHVTHYMYLADIAMDEQATLLEKHDGLCRVVMSIAEDYPDSIAPNPGKVLAFPKVITDPVFELEEEFHFEVFVNMFFSNIDYEERLGMKGDVVFFLTLSLWYEVAKLREKLKIKGIGFNRFEKELRTTIDQARVRREQEEMLLKSQQREKLLELLPHFNLQKSDEELLAILKGLKEVEWRNRNSRRVGVFAGEVTEEEWLATMRGPREDSQVARRRIPWEAKYVCKSFVVQYLDSNFELAEKVFCLEGGKELSGLKNTNISKNKEMCDEATGKIAKLLRAAMRK